LRKKLLCSGRKGLEPHKRGPKFKKSPKDKEIEKLREKVDKLESFLGGKTSR